MSAFQHILRDAQLASPAWWDHLWLRALPTIIPIDVKFSIRRVSDADLSFA